MTFNLHNCLLETHYLMKALEHFKKGSSNKYLVKRKILNRYSSHKREHKGMALKILKVVRAKVYCIIIKDKIKTLFKIIQGFKI